MLSLPRLNKTKSPSVQLWAFMNIRTFHSSSWPDKWNTLYNITAAKHLHLSLHGFWQERMYAHMQLFCNSIYNNIKLCQYTGGKLEKRIFFGKYICNITAKLKQIWLHVRNRICATEYRSYTFSHQHSESEKYENNILNLQQKKKKEKKYTYKMSKNQSLQS